MACVALVITRMSFDQGPLPQINSVPQFYLGPHSTLFPEELWRVCCSQTWYAKYSLRKTAHGLGQQLTQVHGFLSIEVQQGGLLSEISSRLGHSYLSFNHLNLYQIYFIYLYLKFSCSFESQTLVGVSLPKNSFLKKVRTLSLVTVCYSVVTQKSLYQSLSRLSFIWRESNISIKWQGDKCYRWGFI